MTSSLAITPLVPGMSARSPDTISQRPDSSPVSSRSVSIHSSPPQISVTIGSVASASSSLAVDTAARRMR